MARSSELVVIERAYELVVWLSQHLEKFPKSYKFTLGERMGNRCYEVLELLIEARYSRERQPLLRRVNLHLEVLRFQCRIAKDTRCWSVENLGAAARKIDEVGKLVGGWMRRQNTPEGTSREAIQQPVESARQFPASARGRKKSAPRKTEPPAGDEIPF